MDAADRVALPADADSSDLRQGLRLLEALEDIRIPAPSLDTQWQGRAALLAAVAQPRRRSVLPLATFPRRLTHALPGAALATLVVATTAGAAALAGGGTPRATVNEVLSALGFHDQAVRPVEPSPTSPPASPLAGQDNLTWPPEAIETSIPIGLPGPDQTSGDTGSQTPDGSGQKPEQSAGIPESDGSNPGQSGESPGHGGSNPGQGTDNPGHGGENPGQGVGPDGSGTPPGQSGENPGHDGEDPGQGQENQGGGTPPGQGGDDPGQGSGNGNGHGNKP
jgi:hypothetical protein